jgi:hypothetical protein
MPPLYPRLKGRTAMPNPEIYFAAETLGELYDDDGGVPPMRVPAPRITGWPNRMREPVSTEEFIADLPPEEQRCFLEDQASQRRQIARRQSKREGQAALKK